MDLALGNRLIDLRERVVANFDQGNWEELGLLTAQTDTIVRHPRLLRSLSWNDLDYAGNVLIVLRQIVESDPRTLVVLAITWNRSFLNHVVERRDSGCSQDRAGQEEAHR